jgi:hypothetical protein
MYVPGPVGVGGLTGEGVSSREMKLLLWLYSVVRGLGHILPTLVAFSHGEG